MKSPRSGLCIKRKTLIRPHICAPSPYDSISPLRKRLPNLGPLVISSVCPPSGPEGFSIKALDKRLLHAANLLPDTTTTSTTAASDARRPILTKSKHTLNNTQFRSRRIHARNSHPVIDDHTCADDGAAAIDAPGDEGHLQQTAQLVLVLDRGLWVDEPPGAGEGHVGAREDVGGDGLAEDFDAEGVGDDFFCFALQVRVDEGDVVVAADDVAEGREALFDTLDRHGRGEGVA